MHKVKGEQKFQVNISMILAFELIECDLELWKKFISKFTAPEFVSSKKPGFNSVFQNVCVRFW